MKIFLKSDFSITRLKKGYSVKQLAEDVGISKQALYLVERRENGISPANAKKITEVLDVEFDDVFEIIEG